MIIDWNGKLEILSKHLNGSSLNIVASIKEPGVRECIILGLLSPSYYWLFTAVEC